MDYSLLLGVKKRGPGRATPTAAKRLWSAASRVFRAVAGTSGSGSTERAVSARRNSFKACPDGFEGATGERFVVGIIDYLQRYASPKLLPRHAW